MSELRNFEYHYIDIDRIGNVITISQIEDAMKRASTEHENKDTEPKLTTRERTEYRDHYDEWTYEVFAVRYEVLIPKKKFEAEYTRKLEEYERKIAECRRDIEILERKIRCHGDCVSNLKSDYTKMLSVYES